MNNKDLEKMLYGLGEINPIIPDHIVDTTLEKVKNDNSDILIILGIAIVINLIIYLAIVTTICILEINLMYKIYLLFSLSSLYNIPLVVVLNKKSIKNMLKGCVFYEI